MTTAKKSPSRQRTIRVYGWTGRRLECAPVAKNGHAQTREICAAPSQAAVARAAGVNRPSQLFNLCETGNASEIATATAHPGQVFWSPLDEHPRNYRPAQPLGQPSVTPPKLPDVSFTYEDGADRNRVFLWENINTPPFMRPVKGWKIVGYGKAPWPGSTDGFAAMFERVDPPEEDSGSMFQKQHTLMPEGTRIWQHGREEWVPGRPGYEARMCKS